MAAALVLEKKIGLRVVGDEEIHPSVIINVGGNHSPGFARIVGDPHFLAHIRKGAIAVVMKEPARHRRVDLRVAVFVQSLKRGNVWGPTVVMLGLAEVYEAAHEQVELAVVVIVEPHGARGPSGGRDSSLLGYVGEGAVAVVAVE